MRAVRDRRWCGGQLCFAQQGALQSRGSLFARSGSDAGLSGVRPCSRIPSR